MVNIWEENIIKIHENDLVAGRNDSARKPSVARPNIDDAMVKKLEAFFSQDEQPLCEISTKLTFDGLQLNLFSDTDEVRVSENPTFLPPINFIFLFRLSSIIHSDNYFAFGNSSMCLFRSTHSCMFIFRCFNTVCILH